MKRTLKPLSSLVLLLILLGSCSKKNNVPVPEDAGMVFHIDGASLSSKLSWDEFKQGELYKLAKEEIHDDLALKVLDNPDSSGIDIKSDAYFFLRNRGKGGYAAFTCVVKDEKALTRLIQQINPTKTITKSGEFSVLKMGDDAVTIWNSSRFVAVGDMPGMGGPAFGGSGSYGDNKISEDSLLYFAKEVCDIKGSKSISSDSRFSTMIKDKADGHFFLNTSKLYAGQSNPVLTMLPKISMLFEGNATAFSLNFADGKMTADGTSYFNKEMADFYSKYTAKNIDADALKKIPGDVAAAFAMNYPPEGFKGFFSLLGLDGLVNAYLAQLNYSVDDFVKANKGDMFIAVSDFSFGEKEVKYTVDGKEMSYKTTEPEVKVLFGSAINDQSSFDKLATLLKDKVLKEGGPMVETMAEHIPYTIKNNWFVAGNDSVSVNSFGNSTKDHPFISKISGHPMGAYIDIQKFITGGRAGIARDSSNLLMADESLKMWKDIVFYGGERSGDSYKSHFEINLVDGSTNSLKQLHNYLGKMAKIEQDEKARRMKEWTESTENAPVVDSTITVSPK